MEINDHLETSGLSPENCLVKEVQLTIYVGLIVERDDSPVANRNPDMSQSSCGNLIKVGPADEAPPVLQQSVLSISLAQNLRECPLVNGCVPCFLEDRWGDPWFQHEPTANVHTANLVNVVINRGCMNFVTKTGVSNRVETRACKQLTAHPEG